MPLPAEKVCTWCALIQIAPVCPATGPGNFRLGKPFADPAAKTLLVFRLQTAARDEPLHRVEQFQPVLQRRFGHGLPLIETLFALEEPPLATHALGINLQLHAIFRDRSEEHTSELQSL